MTPIPRERDFPDTPEGAKDFTREFAEWVRSYIDVRNKHRQAAIDTLAREVQSNTADLMRGDIRPGWVQVQIALMMADIKALSEDNKGIRRRQWAVVIIGISTLIGLVTTLAVEVLRAQGKA